MKDKDLLERINLHFVGDPDPDSPGLNFFVKLCWYVGALLGFFLYYNFIFGFDFISPIEEFLSYFGNFFYKFGMVVFILLGGAGLFYFPALVFAIFKAIRN
jgi:hypothetical protein